MGDFDVPVGLSPRVRGNRAFAHPPVALLRSIPARAGEPKFDGRQPLILEVYPRACGGTSIRVGDFDVPVGLSPRVRGNRAFAHPPVALLRSIPARAGEPKFDGRQPLILEVYPRACGGTSIRVGDFDVPVGLSPRVRGNRAFAHPPVALLRSIPARAGEPACPWASRNQATVYPRACGGTSSIPSIPSLSVGLSPRVRGNREYRCTVDCRPGSIPARAGEPVRTTRRTAGFTVYPRACGGTRLMPHTHQPATGLSPRVRGNPPFARCAGPGCGSIPARAGEPCRPSNLSAISRVYPRACGGTTAAGDQYLAIAGLSPRVRGNRWGRPPPLSAPGSIPARAGEPGPPAAWPRVAKVYPRACGGTRNGQMSAYRLKGLSPRVRGNRFVAIWHYLRLGSIPARAGEPKVPVNAVAHKGVYPRACGGTCTWPIPLSRRGGLSPRVRGNPF